MREKLLDVFQSVFPDVPRATLPEMEWDSIQSVALVLAIETAFDLSLDLERVAHYTSFDQFLTYLTPKKKGIITDMDGVLWSGIVGEHAQVRVTAPHKRYQEFLEAQAQRGLLIAVASKNRPAVATAALKNTHNPLRPDSVYPLCAGWRPKSESVAEILQAWNITAKDVIFVDDSMLEIAEVVGAFPGITGILFDPKRINEILAALEHHCVRPSVTYEDSIRLKSIMSGVEFHRKAAERPYTPGGFLKTVLGCVTIRPGYTERVQELVNKCNQFNSNGIRRTKEQLTQPGTELFSASYEDKFGPLGTIAAVWGHRIGHAFVVDTMVMSCRAFSRDIPRHLLVYIFEQYDVDTITFSHRVTDDNQPFVEFLKELGCLASLKLKRGDFLPVLTHSHRVEA